ncbi:hypothetical protein RUND412_011397, partial [Rhizina undulata]
MFPASTNETESPTMIQSSVRATSTEISAVKEAIFSWRKDIWNLWGDIKRILLGSIEVILSDAHVNIIAKNCRKLVSANDIGQVLGGKRGGFKRYGKSLYAVLEPIWEFHEEERRKRLDKDHWMVHEDEFQHIFSNNNDHLGVFLPSSYTIISNNSQSTKTSTTDKH